MKALPFVSICILREIWLSHLSLETIFKKDTKRKSAFYWNLEEE